MAANRKILCVESYADIRDHLNESIAEGVCSGYDVDVAENMGAALVLLATKRFDGVVFDGLEATLENRVDFIKKTRELHPNQSMVALLSAADFGLNSKEKKKLIEEKVSVCHKVYALSIDNIQSLFDASCRRGYGEELCFQEGTQS